VLRRSAARFPERHAIAWAQGEGLATLTYAQFLAEAERVAFWLLERADPGDRIAPWSRNSVEWALLEFGCALAGMVVAAWNPGWTDFECEHARDLTEPALVLAGHDTRGVSLIDRAAQSRARSVSRRSKICVRFPRRARRHALPLPRRRTCS
jgi:fatty-acyl-CoA synthase